MKQFFGRINKGRLKEMENIIEVKQLTKNYGNFKAVNNIDFSVKKGEIFGLLGPNGAGKTTTIRMLTGILSPTRGEICIGKYDIQKEPIEAKQIMALFLKWQMLI